MTTLFNGRDRAKASADAFLLSRELRVPQWKIARVLPRVTARLRGYLWLDLAVASILRVELVVAPLPETTDWRIALRLGTADEEREFFEGELRLVALPMRKTHVVLLGRFSFPPEVLREPAAANALHALAEENLVRIFDTLLREVEVAAASSRT